MVARERLPRGVRPELCYGNAQRQMLFHYTHTMILLAFLYNTAHIPGSCCPAVPDPYIDPEPPFSRFLILPILAGPLRIDLVVIVTAFRG